MHIPFFTRTKKRTTKERPIPLSNSAVAASRVTAQVEPDAQVEVTVLSNPVIVVNPASEEFGVESLFEIKSTSPVVSVKVNVTLLGDPAGANFPVNVPRGVNVIPPTGVTRVDSLAEVVFYAGAEEFGGKPGFATAAIQFATEDGSPFTDPMTGAGRQFMVNPGWATVLNAAPGQYDGAVAITVEAV